MKEILAREIETEVQDDTDRVGREDIEVEEGALA